MGKGQKAGLILNIIIPLVAGSILYYYMSADVLFVEYADRILCAGSHPVLWKTDSPESRLIRNFLLDMLWGYALIMTLFLLSDNENGIRIVGKTVDENSFWGTAILLYVENTAGKNVGISVEEMSVNGFMMSPFFTTTVYNGKMSLDDITIFSDDLKSNGIESIEEVELKFHIYDADTYETIADTEPITFSAQ